MPEFTLDDHHRLLEALLSSLRKDAGAEAPRHIETHISSVILSGGFAYKIKKPVNFGFLDFTTLERRRHFCSEEIRLNSRLAPQIYLDVIAISGSVQNPVLNGDGEPIEYAVRMRRFSQHDLMSRLAESGRLAVDTMDALAKRVASFLAEAARARLDSEFSAPEAALYPVDENFKQLRPLITEPASVKQLDRLEQWSRREYQRLREALAARGATGRVRECHGDMHLGNIALIDGEVVIFDGIEFNERMRWTDVLGDVGFLAMDLDDRGLQTHAHRFLNGYFENSGDYPALPLLNFYRVYRAMVRAKVDALRLAQDLTAGERAQVLEEYHSYADLAERYTHRTRPFLCITHGLSGSGKTTIAGKVVDRFGALRLRSDVERKRLRGLAASEQSGSGIDAGIYDADTTLATYNRLLELAETALRAGFPVVVDAAFLKGWQRQLFGDLATRLATPFAILDIEVALPTLKRWLADRQEQGADASEANLEVVKQQQLTREPLAGQELAARLRVHAENPDIEELSSFSATASPL